LESEIWREEAEAVVAVVVERLAEAVPFVMAWSEEEGAPWGRAVTVMDELQAAEAVAEWL